jgi:hypothetical protein
MTEGQYQINDIVTIADPMCLQGGHALYYRGFLVTSNLSAPELYAMTALLYVHSLHTKVMDGTVVHKLHLPSSEGGAGPDSDADVEAETNQGIDRDPADPSAQKPARKKTLAVLVKLGMYVLGQILYVVNKPFGQFDPLYIQKAKYCMLV